MNPSEGSRPASPSWDRASRDGLPTRKEGVPPYPPGIEQAGEVRLKRSFHFTVSPVEKDYLLCVDRLATIASTKSMGIPSTNLIVQHGVNYWGIGSPMSEPNKRGNMAALIYALNHSKEPLLITNWIYLMPFDRARNNHPF